MEANGSLTCSHEVATSSYPSQINPVHSIQSYFLNIHFNIILPFASGSFQVVFFLQLSLPKLYAFLFSLVCATYVCHPFHDSWFNHPNNTQWAVQIMKFLILQFSPVSSHFLPLKRKYLPQHPQPAFFLQYYRQSFKPMQTPAKIMVLHILLLIILDIKQEDKDFGPSSSRNTDHLLLMQAMLITIHWTQKLIY